MVTFSKSFLSLKKYFKQDRFPVLAIKVKMHMSMTPSTLIGTVTYFVYKREQASDKTNEALPSCCLGNIFKDQ